MSSPTYPDREQRPGGRWSTPALVPDLLQLAALERAVAHVAAGWVTKVPEFDDKILLAHRLETALARASALRLQALTLCERDEQALQVRPGWVEPLRALDASPDPDTVIEGLAGVVLSLVARYRAIADRIDPLYDARLLGTVESAIREEGQPDGLASRASGDPAGIGSAIDRALASSETPLVPLDDLLWEPLDRVPSPARPAGRGRPEPGARAHLRSKSRLEDEDLSGELNDNVMSEICAMELMSRCAYEHPRLPWAFHLSIARHASDEARHADMFRRLLVQRGYDEAELPQHASNYQYAYEFPECERGSERELVWRLLIMCTVLEALAIDKLPLEIAVRDTLGQYDLARALDYASTDELFHVENGLRWTRTLCDELNLDPMIERERVHGRFFGRQRDLRVKYLEADPERARWEIEILEGPDPDGMTFESRTERELRKRASFTEAECEQVDRWGYNAPPSSVSVTSP